MKLISFFFFYLAVWSSPTVVAAPAQRLLLMWVWSSCGDRCGLRFGCRHGRGRTNNAQTMHRHCEDGHSQAFPRSVSARQR